MPLLQQPTLPEDHPRITPSPLLLTCDMLRVSNPVQGGQARGSWWWWRRRTRGVHSTVARRSFWSWSCSLALSDMGHGYGFWMGEHGG